ncbi:hypothetical protein ECANGB1_114 [Enterospora canceri]|uniref:Uncharacterized protein n=1 Tax=Enterospora canceri TaxID=1081671 RepID=A0A1Y1S3M7_9MICR|nr:hypothetical protein ECANGB1_114 [Enterospora canceri]
MQSLTTKSVQSASLTLQGIHDVHGSNSLTLSVLSVGDSIPDNVLQEHLKHTTCLFIDQARDTLHAAATSQTTNSWFGDALDVIT